MGPNADRIRRILSDTGSGVRRASEVAPPPPPPREPPPPAPPTNAANAPGTPRERLLARLRELRAGARPPDLATRTAPTTEASATARDGPLAPAFALPSLPDEDGRTLEERVGGAVRHGPKGGFHEVVRRYPLSGRHGCVPLRDLLARPIPLRPRERRGQARSVRPQDAAWLDIETTGLAGGTGTIAFLVGVGRIEDDAFVVRQYFLRDFPDEPAGLEALAADLRDSPLVTFNGRTFDWPLLTTRFRIHRIPVADRDHVDLLPVARRLYAGSLASHALGELERRVLHVERDEDLPGALVPAAYFAWLREARSAGVALAFRHNEIDIVSMAALGALTSRQMSDDDAGPAARPSRGDPSAADRTDAHAPASRPVDAHPLDALGRATLLLQQGHESHARSVLERAAFGRTHDAPMRLLTTLGRLLRRCGDDDAALALWRARMAAGLPFDPTPACEAAKILEHRRRDPAAALTLVEDALTHCPRHDARHAALEHRAARLRGKLARNPRR